MNCFPSKPGILMRCEAQILSMVTLVMCAVDRPVAAAPTGWMPEPNMGSIEACLGKSVDIKEVKSTSLDRVTFGKLIEPVVIRGGGSQWDASTVWSRSFLLERYASLKVDTGSSQAYVQAVGVQPRVQGGGVRLGEYLEKMRENDGEADPNYLFDKNSFFKQAPELLRDISLSAFGSHPPELIEWFFGIGGTNTGVVWHSHAEAMLAVIAGSKRVFLYPPSQTPPIHYPVTMPQVRWLEKVYPLLKDPVPIETELRGGDVLYIPPGYYHATINCGETVAVSAQLLPLPGPEHNAFELERSAANLLHTQPGNRRHAILAEKLLKQALKIEPRLTSALVTLTNHRRIALGKSGLKHAKIAAQVAPTLPRITMLVPDCLVDELGAKLRLENVEGRIVRDIVREFHSECTAALDLDPSDDLVRDWVLHLVEKCWSALGGSDNAVNVLLTDLKQRVESKQ